MAVDNYAAGIRQTYAQQLLKNGDEDRSREVLTGDPYSPILKVREAYPDAQPSTQDFNEMLQDLIQDMTILNVSFSTAGYSMKDLMLDTRSRLNNVKSMLAAEKERLMDINVLCNKYTDFGTAVNLTGLDFSGNFSEDSGVFTAKVIGTNQVTLNVVTVEGNGYEGNNYVYKDSKFLKDTINTANRASIIDGNDIPLYEYSRITAKNTETDIFPLVNFDSVEAKCSIVISSLDEFNKLKIASPQKDIMVADILISKDGMSFKSVLSKPINLNNVDKKYTTKNYIPGSGIVCFPKTNYLKITLASNSTEDDVIAFSKTIIKT